MPSETDAAIHSYRRVSATERIAAALERLAEQVGRLLPSGDEVDWHVDRAASWHERPEGGYLSAVRQVDPIRLSDLLGIEAQKQRAVTNTHQFVAGLPANNVLLWGSRGTGKSSLIHALLNEFADQGLRVVEVEKHALTGLPVIVERLRSLPWRFVLFCDDLSFEADDASYKLLKSVLDGSVFEAAENVLIYATSNRRHLLPEYASDNADARVAPGELHHGEVVEEKLSLSDRFGVWISFYAFNQDAYLEVAKHWVGVLSERYGLERGWDDEARAHALRWALERGSRSGRSANHFARHWVGSQLLRGN